MNERIKELQALEESGDITAKQQKELEDLLKQAARSSKSRMKVGKRRYDATYVNEANDCSPGSFEILGGGAKLAKDGTYYYAVRLSDGQVVMLSSGSLRAEQEDKGTPCFIGVPQTGFDEGTEYGLNPSLYVGVKGGRLVLATA